MSSRRLYTVYLYKNEFNTRYRYLTKLLALSLTESHETQPTPANPGCAPLLRRRGSPRAEADRTSLEVSRMSGEAPQRVVFYARVVEEYHQPASEDSDSRMLEALQRVSLDPGPCPFQLRRASTPPPLSVACIEPANPLAESPRGFFTPFSLSPLRRASTSQ